MGKTILKTDIKRESDFLYYCSTDKDTGCLTVCEAKMSRGKKKATKKATKKKTTKKSNKSKK